MEYFKHQLLLLELIFKIKSQNCFIPWSCLFSGLFVKLSVCLYQGPLEILFSLRTQTAQKVAILASWISNLTFTQT